MSGKEEHYRTLGLGAGAPLHEIRETYRDLVKIWHPDRFSNDPRLQRKAQEQLKAINIAYHALITPGSHDAQSYDRGASPHSAFNGESAHQEPSSADDDSPLGHSEAAAAAAAGGSGVGYEWFFRIAKILAVLLSLNLVRMLFLHCGVE